MYQKKCVNPIITLNLIILMHPLMAQFELYKLLLINFVQSLKLVVHMIKINVVNETKSLIKEKNKMHNKYLKNFCPIVTGIELFEN